MLLLAAALLDEFGGEGGPAGLVAGADAGAVVAVKVFIKEDVVAPMGVALEEGDAPVEGAPAGILVALNGTERDKINYLNGFVRGGLLNLREKRRLPIRLQVTYGAVEGPANTFTKDINEEGVFLFTDKPLPETSQVHMLVTVPGKTQPLSLMGKVSHTIVPADEEPPGMGIVFELDDAQRELLIGVMKELEDELHAGRLPTNTTE